MTSMDLDPGCRKVLHAIQQGHDDIQKITSTTTLSNSQVNYRFQKLEELEMITVSKPDGWVTREIDGQKRKFKAPKQAQLTDQGRKHVEKSFDPQDLDQLSQEELIEKIHELEDQIDSLETQFDALRRQIQQLLR